MNLAMKNATTSRRRLDESQLLVIDGKKFTWITPSRYRNFFAQVTAGS